MGLFSCPKANTYTSSAAATGTLASITANLGYSSLFRIRFQRSMAHPPCSWDSNIPNYTIAYRGYVETIFENCLRIINIGQTDRQNSNLFSNQPEG